MHKIKSTKVNINGLRPEMAIAFTIACSVYLYHLVSCRLTCGTDSKHGTHSKHYVGLAIDLGIKHPNGVFFDQDLREDIVKDLRECLGQQFDVVLERDHIHVEYDPAAFIP